MDCVYWWLRFCYSLPASVSPVQFIWRPGMWLCGKALGPEFGSLMPMQKLNVVTQSIIPALLDTGESLRGCGQLPWWMEQWALIRSYLKQGGRFENCHSRLPFDHHIHAYHAVCACACVWACARAHIYIHTHTTHMYQLEFLTFEAMDCWKACGNTAPGPQKTQSRAFFFCPDSVPQPLNSTKA